MPNNNSKSNVKKSTKTTTKNVSDNTDLKETKKTSKNTTSKTVTKKESIKTSKPKAKKVVQEVKEVTNDEVEEVNEEIKQEESKVEDTPIKEEPPTLDTTCEELHKEEEKVNIGETNLYPEKKKSKTWLKVLIGVLIVVVALLLIGLKLIHNPTEYADKFDDIISLKEDIAKTTCEDQDNCSIEEKVITNVFDNMDVNEDGIATIKISKGVVYSIYDLDKINELDYLKNNNIVIKQLGYEISDNNTINIYSDLTYKNIKATVEALLTYEFDDQDNLIIKFKDAKIGDLPKFIYESKLPKQGDVLYKQNIAYSIQATDEINVNVFSPSTIKDISYDKDTGDIIVEFEYANALNNILDDLFNTDNGNSKFSDILTYYLTGKSEEFNKLIEDGKEYVKDSFGIDIDAIIDLFN